MSSVYFYASVNWLLYINNWAGGKMRTTICGPENSWRRTDGNLTQFITVYIRCWRRHWEQCTWNCGSPRAHGAQRVQWQIQVPRIWGSDIRTGGMSPSPIFFLLYF